MLHWNLYSICIMARMKTQHKKKERTVRDYINNDSHNNNNFLHKNEVKCALNDDEQRRICCRSWSYSTLKQNFVSPQLLLCCYGWYGGGGKFSTINNTTKEAELKKRQRARKKGEGMRLWLSENLICKLFSSCLPACSAGSTPLSPSIYWLLSVIYLNCCLMITIIPNVKIKFPRFHALPSSSSASLSISNCFDVWINFNFIMLLRHLSCLLRLESWVVLSKNHLREMCAQTHYTNQVKCH